MASARKTGRKAKPSAAETTPGPSTPVLGDYVITTDEYNVDTWWRIGAITGEQPKTVLAAHTKGWVIRSFPLASLSFVTRTRNAGVPMWAVR